VREQAQRVRSVPALDVGRWRIGAPLLRASRLAHARWWSYRHGAGGGRLLRPALLSGGSFQQPQPLESGRGDGEGGSGGAEVTEPQRAHAAARAGGMREARAPRGPAARLRRQQLALLRRERGDGALRLTAQRGNVVSDAFRRRPRRATMRGE
jgi:hypothetical protein